MKPSSHGGTPMTMETPTLRFWTDGGDRWNIPSFETEMGFSENWGENPQISWFNTV
jgi:hypothetical protein